MPLEHGAKPGSPGFGRNIAAEEKAGKPQAQSVAIAYRESGEKTRDAMPASVKILGGADPTGSQELVAVPRMAPATPAGTVQNVGFPNPQALPEPYPWSTPPVQSKSVYPQPRVPIATVGGEEVAVKDEDPGLEPDEGAGSSEPAMDVGGLSIVNGKKTGYEISTDEVTETEGEGHGMLENAMSQMHGKSSSGPQTPMDSFAEVEHKAAKEYGSEEAGKRVAAAVGFKNLGKAEMERRAQAGKK